MYFRIGAARTTRSRSSTRPATKCLASSLMMLAMDRLAEHAPPQQQEQDEQHHVARPRVACAPLVEGQAPQQPQQHDDPEHDRDCQHSPSLLEVITLP